MAVAGALALIAVAVVVWFASRADTARAELRQTSCTWHRKYIVVAGVIRNTGTRAHDFEITQTFWLAGLGERGQHHLVFVTLAPGASKRWTQPAGRWSDPTGAPIARCAPTVQPVPDPNPND